MPFCCHRRVAECVQAVAYMEGNWKGVTSALRELLPLTAGENERQQAHAPREQPVVLFAHAPLPQILAGCRQQRFAKCGSHALQVSL